MPRIATAREIDHTRAIGHALQPANILIHNGKVKITDFGLSKLVSTAHTLSCVLPDIARLVLPYASPGTLAWSVSLNSFLGMVGCGNCIG